MDKPEGTALGSCRDSGCGTCPSVGDCPLPLPKPTLYTIPPLEWERDDPKDHTNKNTTAMTPFGVYAISFISKGIFLCIVNMGDDAEWFDEETIELCKTRAEAHYREQLGKCLEVWNG